MPLSGLVHLFQSCSSIISKSLCGVCCFYHSVLFRMLTGKTMAISNGVTVDPTPPLPGAVFDGGSRYSTFQASTQTLSPDWTDFVDPESGIDVSIALGGLTSEYVEY